MYFAINQADQKAYKYMAQTASSTTISDELSSEFAMAILTHQKELNRDPRELLQIVMTVHNTLREYQSARLIAVTGFDQYDDRERAIEAGFNTHLKKPIDPNNLMKLIRSLTS